MYGTSPLIGKFRVIWYSQRMSSSVLRTVVDRGRSRGCRQRPLFSQPRPPLRGFGALLRSSGAPPRRDPAAAWEEGPISDLCRPLDSAKRRFCPPGGAKAVKSVAVMKVRMLLRNRREAKLLFSANTFSTSLPVATVTTGQNSAYNLYIIPNSDASPFDSTCAMCVFVDPGHASDATDMAWHHGMSDGRLDRTAFGDGLFVRQASPHHKLYLVIKEPMCTQSDPPQGMTEPCHEASHDEVTSIPLTSRIR